MTNTPGARRLRLLTIVIAFLGIVLCAWTAVLVTATWGLAAPAWLSWATTPGSTASGFGYLIVLGCLIWAVVIRLDATSEARSRGRGLWFIAASLAAVTLVLGSLSFVRCAGDEVPVLSQIYWALVLFVDTVNTPPDALACPDWPPLAIELARLTGILAVFAGAGAVVMEALRTRWLRSRLAAQANTRLFVGVDRESFPLVANALSQEGSAGTVFVVGPDPSDPVVVQAVAIGANFVQGQGWDPDLLKRALRVRGRHLRAGRALGLSEFACLSADDATNLRCLRALQVELDALGRGRRASGAKSAIRIRVRIDDLNRGEQWWRKHAKDMSFAGEVQLVDRVGLCDATAHCIAVDIADETARLQRGDESPHRERATSDFPLPTLAPVVVIDGESAVALALLKYLAREAAFSSLRAARTNGDADFSPHVLLTGANCDEVVEDARRRWDLSSFRSLDSFQGVPIWDLGADSLPSTPVFAVLTAEDELGELRADRVIRRLWARRVWLVVKATLELAAATSVPDANELTERTRIVRQPLAIADHRRRHASTWDEAASILGFIYTGPGGTSPASHRADPDALARNLRPIRNVGREVAKAGLVWGPAHHASRGGICCVDGSPPDGRHRPDCTFDAVCRAEHADWMDFKLGDGWTLGPRDDAQKTNPLMVPWEDLPDSGRPLTVETIENVFAVLRILGFSPWYRVSRIGRADSFRRLKAPETISTPRGEQTGRPGDWVVTRHGASWIVSAEGYAESYDMTTGQRRRDAHGLLARRCTSAEEVLNRGTTIPAERGDWVIREEGMEWPVPAGQFGEGYVRMTAGEPEETAHS